MGQRVRRRVSVGERAELWRRWKDGQSLSEIAGALSRQVSSIHSVVLTSGGFAPAVRRRSRLALTLAEREEISRGIGAVASIRQIASGIGRSAST